jgi:hypothetical protein
VYHVNKFNNQKRLNFNQREPNTRRGGRVAAVPYLGALRDRDIAGI